MKAMASDWAGEEGIRIHKMVMNVPKFGNDEDYVDEIVADVFHSYLKLPARLPYRENWKRS